MFDWRSQTRYLFSSDHSDIFWNSIFDSMISFSLWHFEVKSSASVVMLHSLCPEEHLRIFFRKKYNFISFLWNFCKIVKFLFTCSEETSGEIFYRILCWQKRQIFVVRNLHFKLNLLFFVWLRQKTRGVTTVRVFSDTFPLHRSLFPKSFDWRGKHLKFKKFFTEFF